MKLKNTFINTAKFILDKSDMDQTNLLENIKEFIEKSGPRSKGGKKKTLMKLCMLFMKDKNWLLILSEVESFQ